MKKCVLEREVMQSQLGADALPDKRGQCSQSCFVPLQQVDHMSNLADRKQDLEAPPSKTELKTKAYVISLRRNLEHPEKNK